MKLGMITYNHFHLKTEQMVKKFAQNQTYIYDIHIDALPFLSRTPRKTLIKHRPDQSTGLLTKDLAKKYGCSYNYCEIDTQIKKGLDYYIICGSRILSAQCIKNKKIINCHPGIIPAARGLDAFKWSIYKFIPLGVTLHYIDDSVDLGEIISVRSTPIFSDDTIDSLAKRHYENEIEVLSSFMYYINNPHNNFKNLSSNPPEKRMPITKEHETLNLLASYIEKFAYDSPV